MQDFQDHRASVERLIEGEAPLREVEELIAGFGISGEEAAALWLYAHALGARPWEPTPPKERQPALP